MKTVLLLIAVLLFCNSCSKNSKLEQSLALSNDNRSELEKVLEYYSERPEDALKYKAALFLIENMKGYYYRDYAYADKYFHTIDSLCQVEDYVINNLMSDIDSVSRILNRKILKGRALMKSDLEYITAEQLIYHIDLCFEALTYPWCRELDFADFCEYVLPYRIGTERVEDWMETYRDSMKVYIEMFIQKNMCDSSICNYLVRNSARKDFFYTAIVPDLPPSSLLYTRIGLGDCKELQALTTYSLRGIGIPIAIDFTPQWAKRSLGHGWCVLVGSDYQIPFLYHDKVPFGQHITSLQQRDGLAKVYRRMYSEQSESLAILNLQEEIPALFKDSHLKDVSELYFEPVDIKMKLSVPPPSAKEYAYLSVFDNQDWVPIAWGKIKNQIVKFKKVAKGNVYLVTYFHQGEVYPASNPFIVEENGVIKWLNPDRSNLTSVCLKRKYPDKENVYELAKNRTIGGKFQITTTGGMNNFTDIYTIDDFPTTLAPISVVFDKPVEATALRYVSAPNSNVYLAELEVYNEQNELIEGEIIGTDGSWYNNGRDKYMVFDHDMLTYFDAPVSSGGWVGLQFKRKEKVGRIVYAPYNDDNGINKGELYELFFFDGGWVSLGEKYGDSSYIMRYDQVPGNALLLLKNKTKGKEIRIFTQEDGNHKWC
ncbi:hypothetical protein [Bacteroides oleiciplenus]|uniref:hypothetical protein n=1 Tax=Bacteroides oleiciplenus TaxID=626931 RepID=UPI0026DC1798|nr:hypothetical protein [Bacteroides oleiciplenus]